MTAELKSALAALCDLIECSGVDKGLASPELFRLAKNDSKDAVKPITAIICSILSTESAHLAACLDQLQISQPQSWNSSKALFLILSLLIHRFNFAEQQFYEAINTSQLLRQVSAGAGVKSDLGGVTPNPYNNCVITNRIRLLVNTLKMWREPKLPDQVDYMTPEEFVIAQSPAKMAKLIDEVAKRTKTIKAYMIWNEYEKFYWGWVTQAFDASLLCPVSSNSDVKLHPKAKAQMARIEKMSAVFAKLPKPKFKPDRMKARSQLTQALLGNIQQLGAAPPGSAKMEQENVAVKNENLEKLKIIVKTVDAIATFP